LREAFIHPSVPRFLTGTAKTAVASQKAGPPPLDIRPGDEEGFCS